MSHPKLFMLLLGSVSPGRNTEQHDIFFGIGDSLSELVPQIKSFWPEGKVHVDAWREINLVDGFHIKLAPRTPGSTAGNHALFFINLGGYKQDEFDEFHYRMLTVAENKSKAITSSKNTAFYKHTGIKGAPSHVDDKFGIDVDDIFEIADVLSPELKNQYSIEIEKSTENLEEDQLHLGYFKLEKIAEGLYN